MHINGCVTTKPPFSLPTSNFPQAGYASQFVFIAGVTCSKLSTAILLYDLTPAKTWRLAMRCFGVSLFAWFIISIICISFQCPLLDSWRILNINRKCLNQPAFWTAITVFDIIQEIFMIVTPVILIRNLCMSMSRKLVVVFAFSFRLLVVGFSILRIYFIQVKKQDTFDAHMPAIFTQLVLCISLTVCCVPFLKSVMENLQSGLLANHGQHGLISGKNGSGQSPSGSYALQNLSASGKMSKQVSVHSIGKVNRVAPMSHSNPEKWEEEMYVNARGRLDINVERTVDVTTEVQKDDDESLNSLSGSERRILGNQARNKVTVQSGV